MLGTGTIDAICIATDVEKLQNGRKKTVHSFCRLVKSIGSFPKKGDLVDSVKERCNGKRSLCHY